MSSAAASRAKSASAARIRARSGKPPATSETTLARIAANCPRPCSERTRATSDASRAAYARSAPSRRGNALTPIARTWRFPGRCAALPRQPGDRRRSRRVRGTRRCRPRRGRGSRLPAARPRARARIRRAPDPRAGASGPRGPARCSRTPTDPPSAGSAAARRRAARRGRPRRSRRRPRPAPRAARSRLDAQRRTVCRVRPTPRRHRARAAPRRRGRGDRGRARTARRERSRRRDPGRGSDASPPGRRHGSTTRNSRPASTRSTRRSPDAEEDEILGAVLDPVRRTCHRRVSPRRSGHRRSTATFHAMPEVAVSSAPSHRPRMPGRSSRCRSRASRRPARTRGSGRLVVHAVSRRRR